ncbi:mannose-1-phosphate guanylyltransferase [Silvibacterium dinghuense]|uniref:mannose-1-phosphate guanylyltransferase n=1 Tax=Silvibacterium dinghuense TaxID=1560006 RepID=A0A4Q1SGU7_9BACT|nr:mannose-1-phosphate guanylyltransferase [Silvibacterium dinghuense]RXS96589.1 mannose-1-phosphate guanyltransferase [Silvibacterium dinghuense]GGG92047.1 mannose-1-phosphate guanylyltransferase [Silvibacterium dinghuense]
MKIDFRPIILAGGSGTRFWPRSRKARAKQVLALDGERTMIQRTVDRLAPLASPEDVWVITNDLLSGTICGQLDVVPDEHVVCEPAARNTAPAVGLAAFLIEKLNPEAVIGIFPADHVIGNQPEFIRVIEQAVNLAAAGENMVVLGVTPTRPETGYGYIETGEKIGEGVARVRRFTEKPNQERAEEFLAAGNYHWNSGIFIWSARTIANAIREHLPETAPLLEKIANAYGTPEFREVFAALYPQCENISVDYAVLEPRSAKGESRSSLYCLPANFGWNDLGSWAALFEHSHEIKANLDEHGNVTEASGSLAIEAHDNYVYTPQKFVALVGVKDLVVVETEDAVLITSRHHSQDVGKVVKELAAQGRKDLI